MPYVMCLTHVSAARSRFVQRKLLLKFICIPLGIALLFAGLSLDAGDVQGSQLQITPAPTQDRLAEPTLPANRTQADHGAQVYWLSCLPCHGDKGQGLTDEFRATYPEEEQNCWESGCHGKNPYESGFTLPKKIPAVIGDSALAKFSDGAQLHAYIRAAMPFWKPGSLSEEDAWKVTAFVLRENKLWNGVGELNDSNAGEVVIPRAAFLTPVVAPPQDSVQKRSGALGWMILIGSLTVLIIVVFVIHRKQKYDPNRNI
jgi:mono/diheme cytochrome c family protein